MTLSLSEQKAKMRIDISQTRNNLSPLQKTLNAHRTARQLLRNPLFKRATRIAFYWPNKSELDLLPSLSQALKRRKNCFLPVIMGSQLGFKSYKHKTKLTLNQFRIPEPRFGKLIPGHKIQLMLVPLLGYDARCNRLGMGGGYYDRLLKLRDRTPNPKTLGVCFYAQQLKKINPEPWDKKVDGLLINGKCYRSRLYFKS
jgi:5-formyltetrahydrofolate cyclo-ligase